jgi:phospholipid/cholesterol/gamma-HCH transport system substrate-binding protein
VTTEFVDLKDDVAAATVALTGTAEAATIVVSNVGREVDRLTGTTSDLVEEVGGTVADARTLVARVRDGEGTIGRLIADDTLYQRIVSTSQEVEASMQNVREMTARSREAVASFTSRDGAAQQIALTLQNTLAEVQEAAADLAEGTEALKRNFLFRGFFRDRGFFDLDSLTRAAYRAGALEGDRTALRIWIDAAVLFETDQATATQRLTDGGRRRVDAAMSDLLRYPRDSPLVVEGYAEPAEDEAAYLVSADRAQIVRDYLLARFRRQPTLTGVLPLGEDAVGSPRGDDRWSGVALTLFVRNDALSAGR